MKAIQLRKLRQYPGVVNASAKGIKLDPNKGRDKTDAKRPKLMNLKRLRVDQMVKAEIARAYAVKK